MKGILDNTIDELKVTIPLRLASLRMGEAQELHIKSQEDYLLGFAHGVIIGHFMTVFKVKMSRELNDEEAIEVRTVMSNRSSELREAIFKMG
jgi:hypothetical protein